MTKASTVAMLSGSLWAVAMRWSLRLLSLVSTLILARLLVPADFGVVAQAMLVYSLLELTTDFGFQQALIHDQQAQRADYDTVWTLQVIRGALTGLVLFLGADFFARFFNEPRLADIITVYACLALATGFANVRVIDFRKHLQFDKDYRYSVYRKLAGFTVTIWVAWEFRSYWAMVAGSAAATLAAVVIGYAMIPYRPRVALSRWRHILGFSKWILSEGIVSALSSRIDTFILGKLGSNEALGLYTVSLEVSSMPSTEVSQPVARAAFPILSTLKDELEEFRSLNTATLTMMFFLVFPTCVGLSLVADIAIPVLLGESWVAASAFVEVLALVGIVRTIASAGASAYLASGIPKMLTLLAFVSLFARTLGMLLGFHYAGPIGLAWGAFAAACLNGLVNLGCQHRIGLIDGRLLIVHLLPTVAGVASMSLCLSALRFPGTLPGLLAAVVTGACAYFVTVLLFGLVVRQPTAPHVRAASWLVGALQARRGGH